jgi:hypothetical protein
MASPKRIRWPLVVTLLVVASIALWFTFRPTDASRAERGAQGEPGLRHEHPMATAAEAVPADTRVALTPEIPSAGEARRPEEPPAPAPAPLTVAVHGLNVVGAGPDDPHEPGMVPHPLDEARQRIAAENRLLQSLNDAMSFRRVAEMRDLLAQYRKLDPSDLEAHQLGYEIIADCLEFPGDASLTAAREFYDSERHSPLRRFVRRICFENGN